jgi:hypothetical protein
LNEFHYYLEEVSLEEVKQSIGDLLEWFKNNADSVHTQLSKTPGASEDALAKLRNTLKNDLPSSLTELLKTKNGNFQLHESFKTLSAEQIIDSVEINSVYGYWNKSYIPFAVDIDENFLILESSSGLNFFIH